MKIVIEIYDETYQDIVKNGFIYDEDMEEIGDAIMNGTPLPKGHGDLKDIGNLKYVFDLTRSDLIYSGKEIEQAVKSMKTIILADKEEQSGF